MAEDEEFEPKLGRIGARRAPPTYLQRVLHTAALAGTRSLGRSRFQGSHIGRGCGVGRVLSARDRYAAFRSRRVVIKSRIVKLQGKGLGTAKAHLRYIQRDGVTRDGAPGELYSAEREKVDGKAFLERCEDDRHQFRFIVSAEDAVEYEDLKPFVRRLMAQMEQDLGTRLDWVAVDHYNTGHPHTHVVLRGKDDMDHDLIIAREYISHGMRERAAEIVRFDLGPRSDVEIEDRLKAEIGQERFTSLDKQLLKEVDEDGFIGFGTARGNALRQTLRAGRLEKLKRLGLAVEVGPELWRFKPDIEPILRRMGARGDIMRTMHRKMCQLGLARHSTDYAIYDPADVGAERIVGRVAVRGFSDELHDRHYLIVDGVDGRAHYIDIGKADVVHPVRDGSIVAIAPKPTSVRAVDRTVADVAAAHGGRYTVDLHLRHDPSATADFAETHVRRLEAIRRTTGAVTREQDGTWIISPDHLQRAAAFEKRLARQSPVIIDTLSTRPLDRQVDAAGATWLDRELTSRSPIPVRDIGFGHDVKQALNRRRQWLIEQELAQEEAGQTIYRANLLAILRRRDLNRAAGQLSDKLGLAYVETRSGDPVEGVYRRSLELASGKFAVIEKAREFTLVPWRPVIERNLGREVSGIMRDDGISWTLGRQRGGPSLS